MMGRAVPFGVWKFGKRLAAAGKNVMARALTGHEVAGSTPARPHHQSELNEEKPMDDYEAYFDSLKEGEEALSYEEYRAALAIAPSI